MTENHLFVINTCNKEITTISMIIFQFKENPKVARRCDETLKSSSALLVEGHSLSEKYIFPQIFPSI